MTIEKNKNGLLKLSVLSISLMISAASAIAVTLPMMKTQFSSIDAATVESLVTIPSFSMMVFILLSSLIIKKIGKKNTVVLGLLLALIGGIIPAFTTNFTLIYLSRFILGAGTGTYNSLAVSLIGDYFEGEAQQKMLGYQTAFSTLGSSFATFLAGIFVNVQWQYAYFVYFLTLPIVLLVAVALPADKQTGSIIEPKNSEAKSKQSVNSLVIFSCIMMFLFFILVMNIYTKTSTLIVDLNFTNQGFLGTSFTIASLIGTAGGFLYSRIRKILKDSTPVVACTIIGAVYLLIPISGNMILLTVVLAFAFIVSGIFIPYMYDILLPGAPEKSSNLAVSLAMVSCNLGSFGSPYVIKWLGDLVGNTNSVFSFIIGAVLFFIMAFVFVLTGLKKSQSALAADKK